MLRLKFSAVCLVLVFGFVGLSADEGKNGSNRMLREHQLKTNLDSFYLRLVYSGEQGKPYYQVNLHVGDIQADRASVFNRGVQIDKTQAAKILKHLVTVRFMDRAVELEKGKHFAGDANGYFLIVGCEDLELVEHLGWDLKMLARIDALQAVLDGDARSAVGALAARLSGWRRVWTRQQTERESAQ